MSQSQPTAIRELHGASLYGFTLLVSLGDRSQAASVAASALALASERADELSRPERAATWLRARAISDVSRMAENARLTAAERIEALGALGVAEPAGEGLAALGLKERAALIAASVERSSVPEVAAIFGRDPAATQRMLQDARGRYVDAALASLAEMPPSRPESAHIAARVDRIAQQGARKRARKRAGRAAKPAIVRSLHDRFGAWLLAGADEDPPRDLAIHASACRACGERIAALDLLTAIDPARAGVPPEDAPAPERPMSPAAWAALALAGVAAVVVLNIAGWRLGEAVGNAAGWPIMAPFQAVLGGNGEPSIQIDQTTPSDGSSPGADPSAGPGESPFQVGPSTSPPSLPIGGPLPSAPADESPLTSEPPLPPGATPLPPGATPLPPGATPLPPTPAPTASPPATQTPAPTRDPTPEPTPAPTPTREPTPEPTREPTPEPTPGLLPECTDLIDNDNDGLIDLLDPGCLGDLDLTEG